MFNRLLPANTELAGSGSFASLACFSIPQTARAPTAWWRIPYPPDFFLWLDLRLRVRIAAHTLAFDEFKPWATTIIMRIVDFIIAHTFTVYALMKGRTLVFPDDLTAAPFFKRRSPRTNALALTFARNINPPLCTFAMIFHHWFGFCRNFRAGATCWYRTAPSHHTADRLAAAL